MGVRPVGGAAVLAAYFHDEATGMEDRTFLVYAGDHAGASPPVSALFQDEPSISFLNLLSNKYCHEGFPMNPRCHLVGTLGNHEFDEGRTELMRLLHGGNHAKGPFFLNPWPGADFPYVNANVHDSATGRILLPPFVIKDVHELPIAFIGAVLKETPTIVTPSGVSSLVFEDKHWPSTGPSSRCNDSGYMPSSF